MHKVKKRTAGVVLFLGAGAAAMSVGGGVASADEGVSLDGTAPPTAASGVSQRIVDAAWAQYTAQNPGTFYSEGQYQAWCANFVSWVLNQAGAPLNSPNGGWRVPAVQTLNNIFASQGKLERPGSYAPKPGDVVLFGNDHTNLVVESDPNSGTITTVGGNESNKVSMQKLSYTSPGITGYGRVADNAPAAADEVSAPGDGTVEGTVDIDGVTINAAPAPLPAMDVFVPEGVDPVLPPAPEIIPVAADVPAPGAAPVTDVFTPEGAAPVPAPEFVPVSADIPVPAPGAVPAPVVDVFAPPAPEVVPFSVDVPEPAPGADMVPLNAEVPAQGEVPVGEVHLGVGALPGPAA